MPILPLSHGVDAQLRKPFLPGHRGNLRPPAVQVRLDRRALLAAGPLALAACSRTEEVYFGDTKPPQTQRVVATLDNERPSLDPALSSSVIDSIYAIPECAEVASEHFAACIRIGAGEPDIGRAAAAGLGVQQGANR